MIIYITSEQALDASLQAAYEQAEYRIFVSGEEWIMRHGALENWLEDRGFVSLAIVTAYNPGSVLLEDAENRQRNAALEQVLQELALPYGPALNQAPDGGWQEPGFWVAGIGLEAAVALGREFGQAAIWWGHREVREGREEGEHREVRKGREEGIHREVREGREEGGDTTKALRALREGGFFASRSTIL